MLRFLVLLVSIFSLNAYSFILLKPEFTLADPEKTKVRISSEGCLPDISHEELSGFIKKSIKYWNDVPDTRLRLSYGTSSSTSVNSNTIPNGDIIVGCNTTLPSVNILGATANDRANGSARIILNANVYTGSYSADSLEDTLTHEMGHALGLAHSNDRASIMTYRTNGWRPVPGYISQDDIDGVVYLYPNNKKELAGLLAGCSTFASSSSESSFFFWDFALSFLSVLGISIIIKYLKSKLMGI